MEDSNLILYIEGMLKDVKAGKYFGDVINEINTSEELTADEKHEIMSKMHDSLIHKEGA